MLYLTRVYLCVNFFATRYSLYFWLDFNELGKLVGIARNGVSGIFESLGSLEKIQWKTHHNMNFLKISFSLF